MLQNSRVSNIARSLGGLNLMMCALENLMEPRQLLGPQLSQAIQLVVAAADQTEAYLSPLSPRHRRLRLSLALLDIRLPLAGPSSWLLLQAGLQWC